jgi:Immunoglobulin I-set domain
MSFQMVSRRIDASFVSAMSMMAPVFEMPLSDVTVVDGERATLECRLTATPKAEVTWYIDGEEIRQSEEFRMTSTADGWYRLIIEDTLVEDEGEYTVKAVNEAGTCISTAYLTVLRQLIFVSPF